MAELKTILVEMARAGKNAGKGNGDKAAASVAKSYGYEFEEIKPSLAYFWHTEDRPQRVIMRVAVNYLAARPLNLATN